MRLDAHQHFWRYDPVQYAWMTDAMDALRRDYLPEELAPLLEAGGFDGSIAVQARQSLDETDWLLELADRHPFIRGVVGWVDLRSADLPRQLERYGARPKLVGVRHVIQDEPDDGFMLGAEFRRGIGRLGAFGLAYDLLVFPRHLRPALRLVQEFPEQRFVLDHLGKPAIRDRRLEPWASDLKALARCENVWCKLSGLVTEAAWGGWQPADFDRYLDTAIEAFGVNRLMIGSDWPVCSLSSSYAATMGIVRDYLRGFSLPEQAAVLGANCGRCYARGVRAE